MKKSFGLLGLFLAAISANIANAGIVIEATPDTDLMAGTQTISLRVLFDPDEGVATTDGFNGVGVDIAWIAPVGVLVSPQTHLLSGSIAGNENWDHSGHPFASSEFSGAGHELGTLGLANPDNGLYAGNLGGASFFDKTGGFFNNAAGSDGIPPNQVLELFTVDIDVTGGAGDTITFVPFGVYETPASLSGANPAVAVDGAFLMHGGISSPDKTIDQGFQSGSVTFAAVPEPSSLSVFALIGFAAAGRRRRR